MSSFELIAASALGIGAASFCSEAEKDIAESPTAEPERPNSVRNALGSINGYEWVDLGLASGTKWATRNVGAFAPEEYGDLYAWGETCLRLIFYDDLKIIGGFCYDN